MRFLCRGFWLLLPMASLLFAGAADQPSNWSPASAARYLDQRAAWWEKWPASQRDHNTVCVSCHTILPYALARPKLRTLLGEQRPAAPEDALLQHVEKRVSLWKEVQPYYLDANSGPGKSRESRATESVLNALVLASHDRQTGHLSPLTRVAFDAAWALQLHSGEHAGAWDWQVFHLAPWESKESQYQGAALMALALGWTPDRYRKDPSIRAHAKALRSYLRREYPAQPLLNRVMVLWASAQLPGLLSSQEQRALKDSICERQREDGGWNLASLGPWTRRDGTPEETGSDGYATGLITLALQETRAGKQYSAEIGRAQAWLVSHQDQQEGFWRAYSLNKNRNLTTDVGRFMSDAATGFAVMALEASSNSRLTEKRAHRHAFLRDTAALRCRADNCGQSVAPHLR